MAEGSGPSQPTRPVAALADTPDHEPLLDFQQVASALVRFLLSVDPPQATVGVFGGYGRGKTTLMRTMERLLQNNKENADVVRVWFNAWRFDREENLFVPFLLTVQEALKASVGDGAASEKIGRLCGDILRAFAGLGLELGPVKFSAKDMLEAVREKEFSSKYVSVVNQLTDLAQVGATGGTRRIVAFIDDLDRCVPAKAFAILENLKSLLDIEGFLFVLGLDPRVIDSYLGTKYGDRFVIKGGEYLEKVFQVSFQIPAPTERQIEELVDHLAQGVPQEAAEALRHVSQFLPANVRRIKRLLNRLQLMMDALPEGETKPAAKALLSLLLWEERWPDVFAKLQDGDDSAGIYGSIRAQVHLGASASGPDLGKDGNFGVFAKTCLFDQVSAEHVALCLPMIGPRV